MCDVCTKSEMVGVASSSIGPVSLAFCKECLGRNAEPEWAFAYLYEDVSEEGEGLAEHVNNLTTFKDGGYVSWQDYVKARKETPSVAA